MQSVDSLLESWKDITTPEQLLALEKSLEQSYVVSTLGEVAEFFGIEEKTARNWRLRRPPMPGEPGAWPLRDIVRWRCDWLAQSDLAAAKRQQDYELGQIQVETKRIELAREKCEILERTDVELWAATALIELREGIMQLPEMLAASAPQDLKDFVREETDRQCRDLLLATTRRLEVAEIGKDSGTE